MSDEAAFLAAVAEAAPGDAAPSLVFADWLEERGDPRAECIRRCALPPTDLADEFAQRWIEIETEPAWAAAILAAMGELDQHVARWKVVGGVPCGVELPAREFLEHGSAFEAGWPALSDLALRQCEGSVPEIAEHPVLPRTREVNLDFSRGDIRGHAAFRSRRADRLRSLGMTGCHHLGTDGFRALVDQPWVDRLQRLSLQHAGVNTEAAIALSRGNLAGLKELDLADNALNDRGLRHLMSAPWMEGVESLDVSGNKIPEVFETLDSMDAVPGFRKLSLSRTACHLWRLASFSKLRGFPQLEQLDLSSNELAVRDIRRLASAPWLSRLKRLELSGCGVLNEGLTELIRGGAVRYLESLGLLGSAVGREGLQALAKAPGRGLISLDVPVTATSLAGLIDILQSHHGRTLRRLFLFQDGPPPAVELRERFCKALQETSIEVLGFSNVTETLQWTRALLRDGLPRLRSLLIRPWSGDSWSDGIASALADSPAADSLLELTLIGSSSTAAVYRIAASPHFRNLRRLRMSVRMGEVGAVSTVGLPTSSSLLHLDFALAGIEPTAMESLARLCEALPQLRSLSLGNQFHQPLLANVRRRLGAKLIQGGSLKGF